MTAVRLTPELEPLAEALAIQRVHRGYGPLWIAGRIGELALAGDAAGVSRFRRIAAEYQRLLGGSTP